MKEPDSIRKRGLAKMIKSPTDYAKKVGELYDFYITVSGVYYWKNDNDSRYATNEWDTYRCHGEVFKKYFLIEEVELIEEQLYEIY